MVSMFTMGIKLLYILGAIAALAYLWEVFISSTTTTVFVIVIFALLTLYNIWNEDRILRLILEDDLIAKRSSFWDWQKIYQLVQSKTKVWRQERLKSETQYDKFLQAIQASPNGLIMLDEVDHIEWCNQMCRSHFRLEPNRDVRQPVTYLLRYPSFIDYMNKADFNKTLNLEGMGIKGDLNLLLQVFPYGENKKLLLSQDVTLFRKNEAMRQDFVANVSHELRTPLTVLNGFLETISELKLSKGEERKYINLMSLQSKRMLTLVEELLMLTRLDSSPEASLNTIVKTKDLIIRLVDDAKNLSLGRHHFEILITSTNNIVGEENEIFSAFSNLITNAVRYTPEGGTITLKWADILEKDATQFSVTDTGIGIAEEHIPRITERFYRVDRSRSRDTGGTGLGLAIVKHVASRHEGQLEVKSALAVGSTFSLTFPKGRLVPGITLEINEG